MKKALLLGSSVLALLSASAADWYYVGGSNEWWNAASYSKTKAKSGNTTMPGAADIIYPTSATQKLYMDDSTVAFLNVVGGLNLNVNGVTLSLDLTTNATVTGYLGDVGGHGYYDNWLIKDGAGVLSLDGRNGTDSAQGIYGSGTSKSNYRYAIGFDVRAGGVRLEPKRTDVYRSYHGGVRVASGATFFCSAGSGHDLYFKRGLAGAGLLTTENTGTAIGVSFEDKAGEPPQVFSGTLSGVMQIVFWSPTYLTGADNSGVSSIAVAGYADGSEAKGIVGIRTHAGSFGNKDFTTYSGSACLRMLNEADETVTAALAVRNSPLAIDGGARGGVTFSPSNWWGLENTVAGQQQQWILMGSNTTPCVFSGPCRSSKNLPSFFVKKRGTGTWRFDCERTDQGSDWIGGLRGVFAVDEGTLETVSLAEKGARCSLGYADQLFEDKTAATNTLATVPYAIRLGSPTTGEGTLSYIGTTAKEITTRPIGVQGLGRLKAPNAPSLKWSGITGLASGVANVLTVECASGQANEVRDLSGNLSVVKDGPGDLTLKGDLTFTGGLTVNEGTATLHNPNNVPFSWFKLTLKETCATSSNPAYDGFTFTQGSGWSARYTRRFSVNEFGLYDSAGKRVNDYCKDVAGDSDTEWTFETLEPGQIAVYPTAGVTLWKDSYDGHAFLAVDGKTFTASKYRMAEYHWTSTTGYLKADDPTTWISLVQRLKDEDIGRITKFDLSAYGPDRAMPTAFEVFGSIDGQTWESLGGTNDFVRAENLSSTNRFWYSNGKVTNATAPDEYSHPGFAMKRTTSSPTTQLAAAYAVSVAAGATLKLEGASVSVNKLTVSAAGAGTLSGAFDFASSGTLEVTNLPKAWRVTLPGTYVGVKNFANLANWTIQADGKRLHGDVQVVDGKLVLTRSGMTIIVR